MSQASVQVVQGVIAAWNAGDMAAVREACHPEIIMRSPENWPESGPFFGQDAVMRAFEQLRETFDSDWQELIGDFVDVGDRVAIRNVWHGIGHGPEMKQESTQVYTVRNGRVFHIEFFPNHADALEALGLSGQEPNSDGSLEVMRVWSDSWNHGDIETFANLYADDALLITDPSWMEAGPIKGKAAIRSWFEGLKESWEEDDSVVIKELFAAGEKVVARIDWHVRGRASGIEQKLDATGLNRIENGKILRQQWYFDHAKALKAAGLSEDQAQSHSS
jgi:ketosteroid isomerase-like protein